MKDEYIIISKTAIQKRIEELEKRRDEYAFNPNRTDDYYRYNSILKVINEIISQSTPFIPDIKDIQIWLSKQSYQKEYGEQEYMMYYDVDVPKIIQDYISNLKLDI